ncbi:metallophosphoesterase [Candidatus Jorgensenbacteria bacterium]|nr:metallophosphoesterase [Candidatus Jorgensenbacteria bacterium]
MNVIIGDIHGCFDELMELLDVVGPGKDDRIIGLGDLVDRGPKSPEVVNFFRTTPNATSLLGNHERKHERFPRGLIHPDHFTKSQQVTVAQFEARNKISVQTSYEEALEYFRTLPLYIDLPEAILVHGGLIYGVSFAEQDERILTGAAFMEANARSPQGLFNWCHLYPSNEKPVIFGHKTIGIPPWPLPQRENLWPIDTGCARGWLLTALTLPDFKVYQVKSRRTRFDVQNAPA